MLPEKTAMGDVAISFLFSTHGKTLVQSGQELRIDTCEGRSFVAVLVDFRPRRVGDYIDMLAFCVNEKLNYVLHATDIMSVTTLPSYRNVKRHGKDGKISLFGTTHVILSK